MVLVASSVTEISCECAGWMIAATNSAARAIAGGQGTSRDLDRAFMHENAEGPTTERWFHASGCRRWVTVRRDTTTDEVLEA